MSIRFNGGDRLDVSGTMPSDTDFSVCGWARYATSLGTLQYNSIVKFSDSSDTRICAVEFLGDGTGEAALRIAGDGYLFLLAFGGHAPIAIGDYIGFAVGIDASNNVVAGWRFPIANTWEETASGTNSSTLTPFQIGIGAGTGDLDGNIRNLKFFQAGLSLDQLWNELELERPIRAGSVYAWYPFVNSSSALTDFSGNGHTLTQTSGSISTESDPPRGLGRAGGLEYIIPSSAAAAYTLTADVGSFALTGIASGLTHQARVTADVGAFALTGIDAGLNRGRTMVADSGSFSLSGQAAGLTHQARLTADVGAFALTGQDSALQHAARLVADVGAIVLSGIAAGLAAGRRILADVGSFSLGGQASGLTHQARITADVGAFTLTGYDADLSVEGALVLVADTGSFALTGQTAGLLASRRLTADVGSIALGGQAAGLAAGRRVTADVGSFSLTGQTAGLYASRVLTAAPGSFTLTGQDLAFHRGFYMLSSPGVFALTGQDVSFTRTRRLVADAGSFTLTGYDAAFAYSAELVIGGVSGVAGYTFTMSGTSGSTPTIFGTSGVS